MSAESKDWWDVLAYIIGESHSASGPDVVRLADRAVHELGMAMEAYLADHGQWVLTPIGADDRAPVAIEGTLAGRAFQQGESVWPPTHDKHTELWVPLVDGTERLGVVRFELSGNLSPHDADFRDRCAVLASMLGHIIATKFAYGDELQLTRRTVPFTPDAELLWQLLPPLTFAARGLVISVILEPYQRVGGDVFDYTINETSFCALFDAVGHDMQSGLTTAVALAAIRNARRNGERDLGELARNADRLIVENRPPGARYVTAVLGWIDTNTGELTYLLAGHPPPLLLRENRTVKSLEATPRAPLGVSIGPAVEIGREQLEPGDRLLLYTDGIVEARDREGRSFGTRRLIEFVERDSATGLSAPETLRRLMHQILEYQEGQVQDDATLMMVDWLPSPGTRPLGPSQPQADET